jgi:alpha-1,6-mannosyltransferase
MRPTEARSSRKASRAIAVSGSIVGVLAMSLVASIPASPLTPLQPPGYRASGPFAATARALGLDGFGTTGAAALGVVAVLIAVGTFLYALRAAWRGELPLRWVLILGIALHVAVVFLPLLLSRDVYSYAFYGRIASLHGANPYVATPVDFRADRLFPLIGPQWRATPDVYGPLFTLLAIGLTKVFGRIGDLITAYQAIAAAAGIALMLIVAKVAEELRPARAAFAVALIGLNPVVLFYAVASGHNDMLVALSIGAGFALLAARRDLWATAVLALGTLVKASAVIPLLLLFVVVVARAEPGRRRRTLLSHLVVAGGLALACALPFLQTQDPTLGLTELAGHEGWLAPTRFFRATLGKVAELVAGSAAENAVEVVVRLAFALALVTLIVLIARALWTRARWVSAEEQGAAWGWALLLLALLGPVLLPWYVTWIFPVAWLLPRVPRIALVVTSVALTISLVNAEPLRSKTVYDATLLFGHYVVTPVLFIVLVWVVVDLRRRLREGLPFAETTKDAVAPPPQGVTAGTDGD